MFTKFISSNSKQFSKLGRSASSVSSFATFNPHNLSSKNTAKAQNLGKNLLSENQKIPKKM